LYIDAESGGRFIFMLRSNPSDLIFFAGTGSDRVGEVVNT
jgi:hypothetical protein